MADSKTIETVLFEGYQCPLKDHHWRMFGGAGLYKTYDLLAHCTGCLRVVNLYIYDSD